MLVVKTAVHGYHVYQEPHVGQGFIVLQENSNVHNWYAMVVHCCDEDTSVIMGYYHGRSAKNMKRFFVGITLPNIL